MELSKEKMLEIAERKEKCVKCDTEKHICIACDNFVCANKVWREEVAFYEQVRELLQADAEGRLMVLPRNVGDTVYEVQEIRKRIQPYTIISIHVSKCSILFGWELKDGEGIYSNVNGFSDYAIGKTVFMTKEEAEAALEKMGG